ncbi:hypothetical protein [Reichenbachiella ulvae]|uniref:Uncharacterized protein n=1 Tax=Reichenbachiella ulvae TaxID=2980104 RepID=A0ABT3CT21_9BACT|nr:hypothetical protein [Reichenbachiella ulvae]MCV9386860.1 hypothetical protein [Reichenbachiella ulvae]
MDNSFFIRSDQENLKIERFHICSWEFTSSSLVEFGLEIDSSSIVNLKKLSMDLYVPWANKSTYISDYYDKLKNSDNSRFIFNDSVYKTSYLDDGQNRQGVIHEFSGRNKLCLLPVQFDHNYELGKVTLHIDLTEYRKRTDIKANIYVRIGIEPTTESIATRKKGIGKSTIIYDIKMNESRNIPDHLLAEFKKTKSCKLKTCFCFHIVPNSYNITFFESEHLKNVRTLEFKPFKNYLDDKRLKRNELMVVFSKKSGSESYSFFTIFSKERIGASQFAIAILINIICGFLFAFPAIREAFPKSENLSGILKSPPLEFYLAAFLAFGLVFYFFIPPILSAIRRRWIKVKSFFN